MGCYRQVPGGAALAIVLGLSVCAIGCDKKDEDSDEETEEDVSGPSKDSAKDESAKDGDDPSPAEAAATGDPESPDTPTPPPTSPTAPPKITPDAGTAAKPDAGTTTKPGSQACLQKCTSLLGQCTVSAGKDGGPFALPDLSKCQAAAEACRKACSQ
ncbi:MAG: hypothetical protein DRI90_04845 [Deltaproteobacteria bacterium]|nr:MAG: hypothetical protein DRI90_04845 [Deltaproteobacteria bacterium]